MKVAVIPDVHLEMFSKEERKRIVETIVMEFKDSDIDMIVFNGDFWAGGKRNRSKVVSLLYRIERMIGKKVMHFPGSHEDFSHSFRFKYYENFVLFIPGSQFHPDHGQKKIFIDLETAEKILNEKEVDCIITHDPFPETVDFTAYLEAQGGIIPAIYFIERTLELYKKSERFRKEVDKNRVKLDPDIEEFLEECFRILNTMKKDMSRFIGREFIPIEPSKEKFEVIYTAMILNGIERCFIGPAVYFEILESFRDFIEEMGIKVVVSGHIHENHVLWKEKIVRGGTVFINPGPGFLGRYCIVNTDRGTVRIEKMRIKEGYYINL